MRTSSLLLSACGCLALVVCSCGSPAPGDDSTFGSLTVGRQRFAVSLRGEDVGYMDLLIQPWGPDSARVVQTTDWNLVLMGQQQLVRMEIEAFTGPELDLGRMRFTLDNGPTRIETSTERRGDSLFTRVESAGRTMSFSTGLGETDYVPAVVDVASAMMTWSEGQERTFSAFDPTTGTVSQATVSFDGTERKLFLGDSVEATRLRIAHLGTTTMAWIWNGELIEERESSFNMVLTRVPPDQEGGSTSTRDLYEVFAVPSTRIERPRDPGERVFLLEGDIDWSAFELDYPPVQTADPPIVRVRAAPPGAPVPRPVAVDSTMFEFLEGDHMIQVEDSSIVRLADSLVGDVEDSWEAALIIGNFVHDALEKTPTVSLPSAVEVLESRKGDCNEHTVLFVALARAAGIPARTCAGIVYLYDRFGYHAWPMVYVGEWVAMDPTLGQNVADATHIVLATGSLEAQQVIMSAMGRLSVAEIRQDDAGQPAPGPGMD
ncbi:transglutaminase domain-containing protein [Candidatus Fermentibacterales bacterium]|nr:transglutaminase domain-containing protein [Candidatus Fermentibacterales bacterium]